MKKVFLFLPILFFVNISYSQQKNFSIKIEQENNVQVLAGQEINLKKEPFKIIVTLYNLEGVYLFPDFSDSIFSLAADKTIPGFEQLPYLTMAEATFNEDQELLINKEGWSYWFYNKNDDWHRFDKEILVTTDSIVGTKTIRRFYFDPKNIVPVSQIDQPLYLFFVAIDKTNKDDMPETELFRLKAKINWE